MATTVAPNAGARRITPLSQQMQIFLIILVGVLSQIGFSGSRVAVSLLALDLGANQVIVGVVVALYALCPMLVSIAIGKYVDRVGLRLPLILGLAGITIGLLMPPLYPAIPMLLVSAVFLGLAHQYFLIPIEAGIGGIGGPERRAVNYSWLSMGWSAANFVGPVIAGFSIDNIGNPQVYWILAAFAALPGLILWFRRDLLSGAASHGKKGGHGSVLELWRMPSLRTVFITGAVINAAQNLFQFYFPIYGHSLGISASALGLILGLVAAASFLIRSLMLMLLNKRTEGQILTYAVLVAAFVFVALPLASNPYALGAIAFLLGLATGCASPMSMSLLYVLTPQGRGAESLGLLKTVYNFSHVVIPLVFGSMGAAFGFAPVFLSNAGMLFASSLLMHKVRLPSAASAKK